MSFLSQNANPHLLLETSCTPHAPPAKRKNKLSTNHVHSHSQSLSRSSQARKLCSSPAPSPPTAPAPDVQRQHQHLRHRRCSPDAAACDRRCHVSGPSGTPRLRRALARRAYAWPVKTDPPLMVSPKTLRRPVARKSRQPLIRGRAEESQWRGAANTCWSRRAE